MPMRDAEAYLTKAGYHIWPGTFDDSARLPNHPQIPSKLARQSKGKDKD